jgi:hypothetical protein
MKEPSVKKTPKIRLPRATASYPELANFFDRHDGTDLLDQGITEIDPDRTDLDRMLIPGAGPRRRMPRRSPPL